MKRTSLKDSRFLQLNVSPSVVKLSLIFYALMKDSTVLFGSLALWEMYFSWQCTKHGAMCVCVGGAAYP